MEYYINNEFKTKDEEEKKSKVLKIVERIIENTLKAGKKL